MNSYATTNDVIAYRGSLSPEEIGRMDVILETCSAELRAVARRCGKNLDEMLVDDEDLALMVKKGVVDASVNYLNSTVSRDPIMSQYSQAAGGYSISGTLVNPGGAFYFPKKFLKDIGLVVQKVSTIEVFDYDLCNKRPDC
jgi:hypothetical protein